MKEGYVCVDYCFNGSVFVGRLLMPAPLTDEKIFLRDIRHNKEFANIAIKECDGNIYEISVDFDEEDIEAGTWYPVVEDAQKNQHFFAYKDRVNNTKAGQLIELSKEKLHINPDTKNHYMGAIDNKSVFSIRKWRNKSDTVRKSAVYVEEAESDDMKVTFTLKESRIKSANETEIWLWSRALKTVYRIEVDKRAVNMGRFSVDFSDFAQEYADVRDRNWEIYLVCNRQGSYYQSRIILYNEKKYKKGVAEGGCDESDRYIINKTWSDGAFQIYFDDFLQLCQKTTDRVNMYKGVYRWQIESFKMKKSCLYIDVLSVRSEFENMELALRHKSELDENGMPVEYRYKSVRTKKTDRGNLITFCIDCGKVDLIPLRYEMYISAVKDDFAYEFRLVGAGRKFYRKLSHMHGNCYVTESGMMAYMMETIGGKIVLECRRINEYDSIRYRFNECAALFAYGLIGIFFKFRKTILFYEKFCTAAQDNSYYMFEYFMERNDRKYRPVYVIESKRPVYGELKKKYKRSIVKFMSIKHLIYLQAAEAFVSTDSKRHCYRWHASNTRILRAMTKKKFVFLQHGVVGLKRVDNIYGKQYANRCDLFVATYPAEKETISRYFGYSDDEIIVTGLARWDKLQDDRVTPPMIFYMPTWRNWIKEKDESEFVETDYFKKYSQILNSDRLISILEDNNVHMIFCFHPKFRDYMHCIKSKSPNITMIGYDDGVAVNSLLMKCSLFITDYSSASWDVMYMDKPVLFYQFDYDMYMKKQGAYIDMETSIFGCRATDYDSFIEKLSRIIKGGFRYVSDNNKSRDDYFTDRSSNHREQIYAHIEKLLK